MAPSESERKVRHQEIKPEPEGIEEEADCHYRLALGIRYTLYQGRHVLETGSGKTIAISSSIVRFAARRPLSSGQTIDIDIDWPVLAGGSIRLQLVVKGEIVRVRGTEITVKICRHAFKRRPRELFFPLAGGPQGMMATAFTSIGRTNLNAPRPRIPTK
jgi:hypothetical protein